MPREPRCRDWPRTRLRLSRSLCSQGATGPLRGRAGSWPWRGQTPHSGFPTRSPLPAGSLTHRAQPWPVSHLSGACDTSRARCCHPRLPACGPATRGVLSPTLPPSQPQGQGAAQPGPTFVRVHHALHHLHRVVRLQLQGHVPHGLHQLREEVRDLGAVLQEYVAVLAVGEVGVAQVGAAGRTSRPGLRPGGRSRPGCGSRVSRQGRGAGLGHDTVVAVTANYRLLSTTAHGRQARVALT